MSADLIRKSVNRVCLSIFIFLGIATPLQTVVVFVASEAAFDILTALVMVISYTAAFLIYKRAYKSSFIAPSFAFKVDLRSVAMIFASLGIAFAAAHLVGIFNMGGGAEPVIEYHSESIVALFFSTVFVPAFFEELFFRGLIMTNLLPLGKGFSIIVSGIIFGLVHGNHDQIFFAFVAGIALGYLYYKTGSLWPGIILHMLNNFIACTESVLIGSIKEDVALRICMAIECTVFVLGAVSLVYLILISKKEREAKKRDGLYGTCLESLPVGNTYFTYKEYMKGFFSGAMIAFLCYVALNEIAYVSLY